MRRTLVGLVLSVVGLMGSLGCRAGVPESAGATDGLSHLEAKGPLAALEGPTFGQRLLAPTVPSISSARAQVTATTLAPASTTARGVGAPDAPAPVACAARTGVTRGPTPISDALVGAAEAEATSLGSTGRTVAETLHEQLAMKEAVSNPAAGTRLPFEMTDPRWPAADGWVKMAQNVNGVEIHYVENTVTGAVDDFKFKGGAP